MATTPTIGIAEATRDWDVSERTLRRRLSQNRVDGAERDDHGHWLIPVTWLAAEFDRLGSAQPPSHETHQIIDLRDTSVADGLAEALSGLVDWSDRIIDAEVRAATALTELESTSTNLRRAAGDLENERAERVRLEQDLAEHASSLRLETDRRERAEQRADQAETQLENLRHEQQAIEANLRDNLAQQRTTLTALEAISGRRTRRKLRRFLAEVELDRPQ